MIELIDLPVGTRFYFDGKLCEVVKDGCCLNSCVFKNSNKCNKVKCDSSERYDRNHVHFKEVK